MRECPPTTPWRFLASLGMTRMITSMKLDYVGSNGFFNTPLGPGFNGLSNLKTLRISLVAQSQGLEGSEDLVKPGRTSGPPAVEPVLNQTPIHIRRCS
jgi:hypothetical protein